MVQENDNAGVTPLDTDNIPISPLIWALWVETIIKVNNNGLKSIKRLSKNTHRRR